MGQSMDVLGTCDGAYGRTGEKTAGASSERGEHTGSWEEDVSVNCAALEDGVKSVVASANRGGARISDEVLLNHELLQYSRQGNLRGVSEALEKGAWPETRRPLVMKPQKPDAAGKKGKGGGKDDEPPNVGMTPIMFSAQKGSSECVLRLLQAKAEVNAVEEDGWSALHFASKEGHLEVCKTLLTGRANPELVNAEDQQPLDLADEDNGFKKELAKLFSSQTS
mmetsp:Transcript_85484/g.151219  ORF Transcript_85484/g.151219 Transcript_85484/m.151219 type:complete len:223 (+) Transcript_85484:68-736(+)|eukprot:CAMPEP_0197649136 /NCGR_PEP_ID=MMETSP1338-20131121/28175_1 /TAXON_ID=43686 ORGANISM="Pelagodinium beii, Strain RCC1491" /NCGR_SAMPLE_ID=MMETSP1338 /ASSEMBLY_ACC=CAM_ASM_000754 /LENGTH=222 /DNA_ID=CAMNT_0043223255 /DNA_START=50 /DNA_END=718 /DNA_ORIENTATION=+